MAHAAQKAPLSHRAPKPPGWLHAGVAALEERGAVVGSTQVLHALRIAGVGAPLAVTGLPAAAEGVHGGMSPEESYEEGDKASPRMPHKPPPTPEVPEMVSTEA